MIRSKTHLYISMTFLSISMVLLFAIWDENRVAFFLKTTSVLPLPSWLILIAGFLIVWRNRKGDVLKPINIVALYIIYQTWFVPLFLMSPDGIYSYGEDIFKSNFTTLAWIYLFSLLAFYIGTCLPAMGIIRQSLTWLSHFQSPKWSERGFILVIFILIGVASLLIRQSMFGTTIFETLKYRADAIYLYIKKPVGGDYIFMILSYFAPIGITIYYCWYASQTKQLKPKLIALALALFFWFMLAPSGRRASSAEVLMMLGFAFSFLEVRFKFKWRSLIPFTAFTLIYIIGLNLWRVWSSTSILNTQYYQELIAYQISRIAPQTALLHYIPNVLSYDSGAYLLYSLFPPLTNRLNDVFGWHRFYLAREINLAHFGQAGYGRSGALFGLLGELYAAFSPVGVILGFFLFGWLTQSLYRVLVAEQHNTTSVAVYSVICPFLFIRLLDGSAEALFYIILTFSISLVLLKIMAPSRTPYSTLVQSG